MKRQPGLKITAQGTVQDWFPAVKAKMVGDWELKRGTRNSADAERLVSINEARERIARERTRQGE